MSGPAPLRFLGLVLGGWVAVRAAMLAPGWWLAAEAPLPVLIKRAAASPAVAARRVQPVLPDAEPREEVERVLVERPSKSAEMIRGGERIDVVPPADESTSSVGSQLAQIFLPPRSSPQRPPLAPGTPFSGVPSRWSVSAWALVRRGEGPQLATGGLLGGSQAGLRATYRLTERLALSGRIYAPLNEPGGAEAALGVEWQPHRGIPVRLLAERRQALGADGRSAFAVLAHGGISEKPIYGRVTLDAYAQAGFVGLKSRDGFVDGAVRLGIPFAQDLSVGLGAWGAAQPGVSRLDVGPQASYRLPAFGEKVRISAYWRVRVAGNARPGSGPALTLSTDF